MSYEDFISKLNPKVAAALKTASESKIEKLETASFGLTRALGGGFAKGRVALVYGSTSSGKSSLLMQSVGHWQKAGQVCAYVDAEGTYDKDWAARLGVNNEQLILQGSKSSGKIEADIVPLLENEIDVIVIDSISDILPEIFISKTGEMNSQEDRKQIGSQAKAITALLNGIHYVNTNTAVILLSQTTTSINPNYVEQVPHGGEKAKFASSQIVRLNSSASPNSQIMGEIIVGDSVINAPVARKVTYEVRKNKLGVPFGSGDYVFSYSGDNVGIDTLGEIVDLATVYGIVRKSGAWYYLGEEKWQGKSEMLKSIRGTEAVEELKMNIEAYENGGVIG